MAASWARHSSEGGFFNFVAWTGLLLSIAVFSIHSLKIYQWEQCFNLKQTICMPLNCRRPAFRLLPWHQVEIGYRLVEVMWTAFQSVSVFQCNLGIFLPRGLVMHCIYWVVYTNCGDCVWFPDLSSIYCTGSHILNWTLDNFCLLDIFLLESLDDRTGHRGQYIRRYTTYL